MIQMSIVISFQDGANNKLFLYFKIMKICKFIFNFKKHINEKNMLLFIVNYFYFN